MRLFIGIALPADLQTAAATAASQLRARLSTAAPTTTLRWVSAPNLHLTLHFLGEVPDQRVDELEALLRAPYPTPRFALRIGGAGMFPPSGAPRALWLGVRAGAEPLRELHSELGHRLTRFGVEPERRPFAAHLTIARSKDGPRSDARQIRAVLDGASSVVGECQVDAVTLFESHLSPRGSQYEHRLRVPLV